MCCRTIYNCLEKTRACLRTKFGSYPLKPPGIICNKPISIAKLVSDNHTMCKLALFLLRFDPATDEVAISRHRLLEIKKQKQQLWAYRASLLSLDRCYR